MKRKWTALAGVGALVAGLAACTAGGIFKATVPGIGSIEFQFSGEEPHRKMSVSTDAAGLEGTNICLVFMDEDGNETGSVKTPIPAECVPIPAGSEEFCGEECPQEEEPATGPGGGQGIAGKKGKKLRKVKGDWLFWGAPLGNADPFSGILSYHMTVFDNRQENAREASRDVVARAKGGFLIPPPANVEIHDMAYSQVIGTDMVLTFADEDRWQDLRFSLNGQANYRTLSDAVLIDQNGWHLACISIPLADLEGGLVPGVEYTNEYTAVLDNESSQPVVVEGSWTFVL